MTRRIEVEIIGDPRSLEAAFGRSSSAARKFGQGLQPVARASKIALLGIGVLGAATVKLANDFNRTSSQMVGLAGVGEGQVERWKESLLDLAPIVGQAPNDLAKALYFVSSSGVATSKALDVVDKSARASAAGLGETATVADAVTSAMNAYATENLSAAEATDVLVATVREGKGEAAAIAPVLGNILPIASQLGVGFNEVGAAMASMTRLGFDAAESATNIQATLSSLLKPSVQAEQAFQDLGTSSGELRTMLDKQGLLSTLQYLEEAFDGNTAAMARAFPNVRALRGVLSLVGKAGDDTAKVFASMEDNTGALGTAFRAVADQDGFRLEQSLAKIQAAGIRLGDTLAPAVATGAEALADAAGFAGDHETATRAAAAATAVFATTIIGANSALSIYNSRLVEALGAQTALRGALVAGGWAAAVAGIALVVHEGLDVLHDRLNEEPAIFGEAADAARDYRQALTDLNTTATGYEDAQSRSAHANLNVKVTARAARDAIKEFGRSSLEAKQAILNHKDAVREAARAERDLTKAHRDNINAQQRTQIGVARTSKAIGGLREQFAGMTKGIDRSNDANRALLADLDAAAVAGFAARVRKLAEENGGLQTKAGRAATAVADLTLLLGRIPTRKEINLVTNADRTRDQIEAVRAAVNNVPTVHTITFNIQTHGSISAPTGLAEGGGASGAIVNRPTIALIGERGPEALVPLSQTRGNSPLPRARAGGGDTYVFQFPNYRGDDRELDRLVRGSLERALRKGAAIGTRRR